MGWSVPFRVAINSGSYAPRYLLEWVQVPAGTLRVFGGNVRLSSFPAPGYQQKIREQGLSVSGGTLSLRDWSCSPLMFSVGVLGEELDDLRQHLQRGQAVVLKMGFSDDPNEFESVALGTVYGLSRSGSGWEIRCRGLEGSLTSRITTEAGKQALGYDLGSDVLSTAIGSSDTTIDVPDASVFRFDGVKGAVLITANDSTTYYATFTGTSSGTGAGGSDQLTGVVLGFGGTTWSATSSGNAIAEVMFTQAHPLEIAARILASTGAGTNGIHDVLPASWGFGIPEEHIADRDIESFRLLSQPTSGADNWAWLKPSAIEDPQTELAQFLNPCGYFLTQHRGRLTARCVVRTGIQNTPGNFILTDAACMPGALGYEAWNPDTPTEYERCRILYTDGTTAGTSAASDLDHIPSRGINTHTMGGVWSGTANAAAIVADLVTRLKDWDQRTAEVLSLRLHGWGAALGSPGDVVTVDLSVLTSRLGGAYNQRAGLLLRCAPDWFGSSTYVEIAVLPADEVVPWRPAG